MEVLGSGTTRVVVLPGAGKKYTEFRCVVHHNSDTTFSAIRLRRYGLGGRSRSNHFKKFAPEGQIF